MGTDDVIHKYIPEGMSEPTTVLGALRVGRAILAEEGRWRQHKPYSIENPDEDPSTPFCDSWMVCSVGALEVSLFGLRKARHSERCTCSIPGCSRWFIVYELATLSSEKRTEVRRLYGAAVEELGKTIGNGIIGFNDRRDSELEDVLKVWDDTIARLEVAERGEPHDT